MTATSLPDVNITHEEVVKTFDENHRLLIDQSISDLMQLDHKTRRRLNNLSPHDNDPILKHQIALSVSLAEECNFGALLLSPAIFTTANDERLTPLAADVLIANTALGKTIIDEFSSVNLFRFIDRLQNPNNQKLYRNITALLLASMATTIGGIGTIKNAPASIFLKWLSFYRTQDGLRWNDTLWSNNHGAVYKCLKELCGAYHRLTGRSEVLSHSGNKRLRSGEAASWHDIRKNSPDHHRPWLALFDLWQQTDATFSRNRRQMMMHLLRWINRFETVDVSDPKAFLTTAERTPSFASHIQGVEETSSTSTTGSVYADYLGDANRFSHFVCAELQLHENRQAVYHIVGQSELNTARRGVRRQPRPSEAKSRPLPMRFYRIAQEILREGESGWPGSTSACQETIIDIDGNEQRIYCPVLATLFLTLFILPLRVGQLKRLDSGEGDTRLFNGISQTWMNNEGRFAGYWHARDGGDGERGYAREARDEYGRSITGFWINTNKTGSPYLIPWQHAELHRMMMDLRIWQQTYNPICRPVRPEEYVDGAETADSAMLRQYPDIFPLFRLPPDVRFNRPARPPTYNETNNFWLLLMVEVERRYNAEADKAEQISIVRRNAATNQPTSSLYNAHGLRVAGLTLMYERGVPFEILSKLVAGHCSLLMTLYYLRFDPGKIHDLLEEAELQRHAVESARFIRDLKSAAVNDAHAQSVSLFPDSAAIAFASPVSDKALWVDKGIGICPWDGTRCRDGGACLKRDVRSNGSDHSIYSPVEGGSTCVLCRHFITGPAWTLPLWLYGSKLLSEYASKGRRIADLQVTLEVLIRGRKTRKSDGLPVDLKLKKDISMTEAEIGILSEEQHILGSAVSSTRRILEALVSVQAIEKSESGFGRALVANDAQSVVQYMEVGDFAASSVITAASRVYPILHSQGAEDTRNRELDAILFHSGYKPLSFSPLSPDVKRRAQDAFAKALIERVNREETSAMIEGRLRLQDLSLEAEIDSAAATSIGLPILVAISHKDAAHPTSTIGAGQPSA